MSKTQSCPLSLKFSGAQTEMPNSWSSEPWRPLVHPQRQQSTTTWGRSNIHGHHSIIKDPWAHCSHCRFQLQTLHIKGRRGLHSLAISSLLLLTGQGTSFKYSRKVPFAVQRCLSTLCWTSPGWWESYTKLKPKLYEDHSCASRLCETQWADAGPWGSESCWASPGAHCT